jgi:hypothetical protein
MKPVFDHGEHPPARALELNCLSGSRHAGILGP